MSSAHFTIDPEHLGTNIPEAIRGIASLGATVQQSGYEVSLRARYFSAEGSRFVERILTVTQTCIKQGLHVAKFVEGCVRAFRQGLSMPKLIHSEGNST